MKNWVAKGIASDVNDFTEGGYFTTQKPPPDKMKITNRNFTKKENLLQLHHNN